MVLVPGDTSGSRRRRSRRPLRSSSYEPTGGNLDHFDVQLVPSWTFEEGSAGADTLAEAAARVLDAAGELQPNPAYAGAREEP